MTTAEHHDCFNRWLHAHAAVLHHVANGFAAGADRHDLMQELLLALWRAVPAFRGHSQASTFVFRVAHNAALTWARTERNHRHRVERFEALVPPAAPTPSPEDNRTREMLDLLYTHIRRLPAVDRSLILLHLDGVSYRDIAGMHGLSETNVGVRLNRLRQKLCRELQEISHELR